MAATTTTPDLRYAHLRPSRPQALPFGRNLEARAFLLERDAGNILIYSTGRLADDAAWLAEAGVERHYLNHWHESMFGLPPAGLGASLLVHRADAPYVADRGGRPLTFDRRHRLADDFEVIPIPGHTAGATAYLWDSGERRFLFIGDSVIVTRGRWRVVALEQSDRASYIESLARLREVEFDVLVPWVATAGEPWAVEVGADERRARFDKLIDYLRSGA